MKRINLLLTGCLLMLIVSGQSTSDKVALVENSLGGWVKLENAAGWNILDRMAHYKVNGISIAVIDDYKIVWAKGYGWADTAEKRRVTTSTLFQPASIGKSLHAVATMALVEKGQLDPYADINRYLKRWKFPYDSLSQGKKINTLNLLSHTGGLSVHGFDGYKWGQPLPTIIQILNGEPPSNSPAIKSVFEPGTKFQYSGGGYTISGMMLEDITGMKYATYLKRSVINPLGMKNTYFYGGLTKAAKKNLATGYRFDGKDIGCKYHIYPEDACGASLWSTPGDFAKLLIELQLSLTSKSNKVLGKETVKRLLTPFTSDFYGLGFFIEKRGAETYFHHSGLNEGFVSDYYASMDGGRGVVVMANTDLAAFEDITEEIINSVATVYGWAGFYTPVIKKEITLPDSTLKNFVGDYYFGDDPAGPSIKITFNNGKLFFLFADQPWQIHFTAANEFFMFEAHGNTQVFERDGNGTVTSLLMRTMGGDVRAKRK